MTLPRLTLYGPGGTLPLDRVTIESLATFFVGLLDLVEPDPDVEETDAEDELLSQRALDAAVAQPGCIVSDPGDVAWLERINQTKPALPRGCSYAWFNPEDAEDDDPAGGNVEDQGEPDCDAEIEQMCGDIPVLPVYALEPSPLTGKRECLGMNDLQPAFKGSGPHLKVVE